MQSFKFREPWHKRRWVTWKRSFLYPTKNQSKIARRFILLRISLLIFHCGLGRGRRRWSAFRWPERPHMIRALSTRWEFPRSMLMHAATLWSHDFNKRISILESCPRKMPYYCRAIYSLSNPKDVSSRVKRLVKSYLVQWLFVAIILFAWLYLYRSYLFIHWLTYSFSHFS